MAPEEQLNFLKNIQQKRLDELSDDSIGSWGVMNAQEMVEHLNDIYSISIENVRTQILTPQEHLPKYREFLYSDKAFRENTKAPESLIGATPIALRNKNLESARESLNGTILNFFDYFNTRPDHKTLHPVFGTLNFEEWVRLHYKHVTHHFRQFNLLPPLAK